MLVTDVTCEPETHNSLCLTEILWRSLEIKSLPPYHGCYKHVHASIRILACML